MTEHSTDNKRRHKKYLRPLEKFIYSKYNHVISISKQAQEQLLKWLRFKSVDKYSVIENGIDIQRFKNAKPYDKKTICNNYKDGDILISLVGSFSVQKNHKNMVMAMKLLPDNYKLLLIGEGPLMEDIKLLVKDNCLQDRIRFMGFRTDVAEIIHTSDLVCIPSLWEGFGLIAAEAMACGTAVVSSNVTGLSDVIGDCGYKFNPNEPQSISEAIIKTVKGKNKNLNIEKGKKHAEKFDIDRLVDEYLYIYEIVQQ
jgi:glycosyltransferase involved in cell wall biosynthesis